ncbi:MAG: acyl-CoA dehydrogenase family protein, partial [Geodermatophilaceae bacterium]
MEFGLSDEQIAVRDTVRTFVRREVMPLETECLRNERAGRPGVSPDQVRELQDKAEKSGFWGVNTPEEYGGMSLGPVMTAIVLMELGRSFVPFNFG